MRSMLVPRIFAPTLAALFVLATATPALAAEPKVEASKADPKVPSSTFSNPRERGLLVVDARVRRKTLLSWSYLDLQAGGLSDSGGAASEARYVTKARGGLLIFALDPGRYRPLFLKSRGPR